MTREVSQPRSEAMSPGTAQRARAKRAAENSPGRKPGVTCVIKNLSPFRGDRKSFCRPLRGLCNLFLRVIPGLTPGAIFCRRLRRLLEQSIPTRNAYRGGFLSLLCFFPLASVYSQGNDQDYSKFLHTSSKHASIGCANCHHRNDNSSRPSFPGHKDCTSCHLTQFTTPNIPMCSICHRSVNGNDPPRKAFPDKFKESFNIKFDHAQHMTGGARPKNGCVSCHNSPMRRGVALSIPTGMSAHDGCYACHTPNAQANGRDIASCGVCHSQKSYARTPTDSPAFRVAFSHAQHGARQRLDCSSCHNYTAGLPQRRQVNSPRAQEHFPIGNNTCATCHSGRRSFGGDLDFRACRRCHTGSSFRIGT
jgi:hypothetical protein